MVTTSRHFLAITAAAYFLLGGFIGELAKVIVNHTFVLLWVDHNLLILAGTVGNVIGLQHLRLLSKSLRSETTSGDKLGDSKNVKLEGIKNRLSIIRISYVVGAVVFALMPGI
jgi:hypothetical protein